MMQFKINEEILSTPIAQNAFVVFVTVDFNSMYTVEFPVGPFPFTSVGADYMTEFLELLPRIQRTRFGGYRPVEDYPAVEGYSKWLADRDERSFADIDQRYLEFTKSDVTGLGFPHNPLTDYMTPGALIKWRVAYFDMDHKEHSVTVTS